MKTKLPPRTKPYRPPYRQTAFQRFATWLFEWAERFFLKAHGWDRHAERSYEYLPPSDYPFASYPSYVRSHAVNATKQYVYNPIHGGTRRDPDLIDSERH